MAGLVSSATLQTGTQLGASGGAGYYEITKWNVSYTTLTINSSDIAFTGLGSSGDCVSNTSGLGNVDGATCTLGSIAADELLWIGDFINESTEVTVLNFTGTLTNASVCYNTTGGGNITLRMEDVGGDCNYNRFNLSGYTDSVAFVSFDRQVAAYTECYVIVELNSTLQTETCFRLDEDTTLDESNLSTILASVVVSVTLISVGSQWDSKT